MESLSDKLRSLGVQVGVSHIKPKNALKFDDFIAGEEIINSLGAFYLVDYQYDFNYQHGTINLGPNGNFELISRWARITQQNETEWKHLVFIDTETSGVVGGAGTLPFLVGIGRFTETGFRVTQTFLRKGDEEAAALLYLSLLLDESSILVSYNGKSFDIPILRNRLVINQQSTEITKLPHIDLLPLARRLWKLRLESRSLKNIEVEILQFMRTDDEIPGWLVPEIYADYIRTGEIKGLDGIIYHNRIDIVSLASVFCHINWMLAPENNRQDLEFIDKYSIARLLDDLNEERPATELFDFSFNSSLPDHLKIKILLRNAALARKNNDINKLINLLETASEMGEFEAAEKLAILFELKLKNYPSAYQWAKKSQEILDQNSTFSFSKRKILTLSVLKRIDRIKKKMGAG